MSSSCDSVLLRFSIVPAAHFDCMEEVLRQLGRLDIGDTGVVSRSELSCTLRRVDRLTWTRERTESMLNAVEKNHDGLVRYREFVSWAYDQIGRTRDELPRSPGTRSSSSASSGSELHTLSQCAARATWQADKHRASSSALAQAGAGLVGQSLAGPPFAARPPNHGKRSSSKSSEEQARSLASLGTSSYEVESMVSRLPGVNSSPLPLHGTCAGTGGLEGAGFSRRSASTTAVPLRQRETRAGQPAASRRGRSVPTDEAAGNRQDILPLQDDSGCRTSDNRCSLATSVRLKETSLPAQALATATAVRAVDCDADSAASIVRLPEGGDSTKAGGVTEARSPGTQNGFGRGAAAVEATACGFDGAAGLEAATAASTSPSLRATKTGKSSGAHRGPPSVGSPAGHSTPCQSAQPPLQADAKGQKPINRSGIEADSDLSTDASLMHGAEAELKESLARARAEVEAANARIISEREEAAAAARAECAAELKELRKALIQSQSREKEQRQEAAAAREQVAAAKEKATLAERELALLRADLGLVRGQLVARQGEVASLAETNVKLRHDLNLRESQQQQQSLAMPGRAGNPGHAGGLMGNTSLAAAGPMSGHLGGAMGGIGGPMGFPMGGPTGPSPLGFPMGGPMGSSMGAMNRFQSMPNLRAMPSMAGMGSTPSLPSVPSAQDHSVPPVGGGQLIRSRSNPMRRSNQTNLEALLCSPSPGLRSMRETLSTLEPVAEKGGFFTPQKTSKSANRREKRKSMEPPPGQQDDFTSTW